MSSLYKKSDGTIGYTSLRDAKRKRDPFTVMPEFGITVFDRNRTPYDRVNNKFVYAHIPSVNSQFTQQEQKKISSKFQQRIYAAIDRDPSFINSITPSERAAYLASRNLTTMSKRKYNFDAEFGDATVRAVHYPVKKLRVPMNNRVMVSKNAAQASLATQVRRLIAGKKKDAVDVSRLNGILSATRVYCLTSSTAGSGVAPSGSGILATSADRAQINHVEIRGSYVLRPISCTPAQLAITSKPCARMRQLVVWFYKPKQDAAAAGTLPPITEVLVRDDIESLAVPDTDNAGRFTILSDRIFNLGRNLVAVDTTATQAVALHAEAGLNTLNMSYTVKVNKQCFFKKNADDVTNLGGHYDSDVDNGQISKGLLMMYTIADGGYGVAGTDVGQLYGVAHITRVNYTA